MIPDLTAVLDRLATVSAARVTADRAADRARLAQRSAVIEALNAGVTVYRCAQVSGLTQPGVRKMVASRPARC